MRLVGPSTLWNQVKHNQKRPYTDMTEKPGQLSSSPTPKQRLRQEVAPAYKSANYMPGQNMHESHRNSSLTSTSLRSEVTLSFDNIPMLTKESKLPFYEPTKCSSTKNGIIKAYAANTNQGIVRDYNEDRVSIILNIVKPQSRVNETWPKCSFFGVYDGHGGSACADFLRDNLHQFVIRENEFPWNPTEALKKGFEAAEKYFIEQALQSYSVGKPERSGSCAIVALFVGDMCYIANVGDSRAVLSSQSGKSVYSLSRDHKPCDDYEQNRISLAGGKIYQTQALTDGDSGDKIILGPLRVFPGRLSVSRTFGDIEAKLEKFGGNPRVVVAEPDIKSFKITPEHDFIVLACDGIFDKMSSDDVMKTIWDDMNIPSLKQPPTLHSLVSSAVESVLKESINRRTFDNITVVIIAFSKEEFKDEDIQRPMTAKSGYQVEKTDASISPNIKTPYTNSGTQVIIQQSVAQTVQPFQGLSQRDQKEEKSFLSKPYSKQPLLNKQLRSSYEYKQSSTTQRNYFSYIRGKESLMSKKLSKQDENKENNASFANKFNEYKKQSENIDLKLNSEFLKQYRRHVPFQVQDIGSKYPGRIY